MPSVRSSLIVVMSRKSELLVAEPEGDGDSFAIGERWVQFVKVVFRNMFRFRRDSRTSDGEVMAFLDSPGSGP
jgi:hypothetical protein